MKFQWVKCSNIYIATVHIITDLTDDYEKIDPYTFGIRFDDLYYCYKNSGLYIRYKLCQECFNIDFYPRENIRTVEVCGVQETIKKEEAPINV